MDCEYKIPFPGVGVGCGYGTDMKPTCWLNTRRCNEDKCPLMIRGEKNHDNTKNKKERNLK